MPFSAIASITIGKVTLRFFRKRSFFSGSKANTTEWKMPNCAHFVNTSLKSFKQERVYLRAYLLDTRRLKPHSARSY